MDGKSILLLFVLVVIGFGIAAGGIGFLSGSHDSWSPRDYAAKEGEWFVAPQGDPLYDAHYAQEVNVPNSEAIKNKSDAQYVDAQTEKVVAETKTGLFGVWAILGVVCASFVLLIIAKFS